MPTLFVTGASRGIGREFVRQFAGDGWPVLAGCRNPEQVEPIPGAEFVTLDVDDPSSVSACRDVVGVRPVDVLINNAGIVGQRATFGSPDYEAWARAMNTNVFGSMRVAEALVDNVLASSRKQMIFISSYMGSIALASANSCVYRSSKAALNMAVRCLSLELQSRGVTAVMFHPGHVSTDMGGPAAPVTPERSVAALKRHILALTKADNGRFLNWDGKELPW